jgi:AraC family transcriptional activator of pobA
MPRESNENGTKPGLYVQRVKLNNTSAIVGGATNNTIYQHSIVLVVNGDAYLQCPASPFTMAARQAGIFISECLIRPLTTEPLEYWLVSFTKQFALQNIYSTNAHLLPIIMADDHCCKSIDNTTFKAMKKIIQLIALDSNEIIPNASTILQLSFNLLLSCLVMQKQASVKGASRNFSRREEVAVRFLSLAGEHATGHHPVSFYADKLFMTPGNLTKIIKEVTGKTPKMLMGEELISEAKHQLDRTLSGIYEVAENLNFSSSSAFINFFRSHTGYTPLAYRNRK